MSTEKAVAHGIKTTAGTITAAAIIMVAVFAEFATQSSLDISRWASASPSPSCRRDDHPRRPAPGDDEAARRLELVPAALAAVDSGARPSRAPATAAACRPGARRRVAPDGNP